MNVKELNNKFGPWNPMENDYKNKEFNHYVSGPGAELDDELQPSQQALQNRNVDKINQPVPALIFKYLPKGMTTRALHNICSMHGRVREVRDSTKNDFYFVDLVSVSDMEAVFRALENNNYGFQVMVSKNPSKKSSDMEKNRHFQNFPPVPPANTGIDYDSRNYHTSKKNHPRPKVQEDKQFSESDAGNTGLPLNLLTNDAHCLERQGLYKMPMNNKFNYRNGRSYINMPDKMKEFIEIKHNASSGTYYDSEDKFVYTPDNNLMPSNINKCSQCYYACDTVCERCSQYYCSVDCQSNDWPKHRYICGKPKHLQKAPPSGKEPQTHNKFPKTLKENNQRAPDTMVSKVVEEKVIKNVFPHEFPSSSKTSPQSVNFSKSSPQKLPAALKAFNQQPKSSAQQLLTPSNPQEIPICTKPASKRLPAALLASKQLQRSSKESSPQPGESLTAPQQQSNKPPENGEEIYKQNMPRSGSIVTITSIVKTSVVFIRSTSNGDNLSYFNTVDALQSLGKTLQPLRTLPKSGDMVIAKFEEQFNRALVLKSNKPSIILINFMDYGNTEQVSIEDLYEAPKEFVYKPRHAIPILLKDVTDYYMTDEIRKFMHTYLNNINVEIRYKPEDFRRENNIYAVELIDENTEQNLNKTIMKLSKPQEPQSSDEICDRNYLESVMLPVGNNIELIVMDNSLMLTGCISCTTKAYAIEIEKFKKEIQNYVESIPKEAYTPRPQELCIAQYNDDGLWYRGFCVETVGDGHPSIHFIDYGNITIVPIESIRRYPRQFTYPVYTFDCAIDGLPERCGDKLVEKLEDLIPNEKIIECEEVTVAEENFYNLSLPSVIRELSKCGFLDNSAL